MDAQTAIGILKRNEGELRSVGIARLSIFGSTARGTASRGSDVDIAIRFDPASQPTGFTYFGRLSEIEERLSLLLGEPVDVVTEPVRKATLAADVERDRIVAFE